jgi:hypothetical protein
VVVCEHGGGLGSAVGEIESAKFYQSEVLGRVRPFLISAEVWVCKVTEDLACSVWRMFQRATMVSSFDVGVGAVVAGRTGMIFLPG